MSSRKSFYFTRRDFLKAAGAVAATAAVSPFIGACASSSATSGPLKIGVLLPYSDIYAVLGESITEAMRMYFEEVNNQAGGRTIELITEDEGTQPDVAQQKARKLVEQDEVAFMAGVVSSGVLGGLRDYLHDNQKLLLCANAGANALSRAAKTPYIWRISFTNWMPNWPAGTWAAENIGTRAYISVPDYAAGQDTINAFSNSFQAAGGEIVGTQLTPFPNMGDPAPFIAELADAAPDFVYSFYSGGAAVTFVKAYSEFGLANNVPLLGSGFMVEQDVLPALAEAALGVRSGLHWALPLDNAENTAFKEAYMQRTGKEANVFAVQGYDTARVIVELLNAVQGDTSDVNKMIETLPGITFNSPRGPFALDQNSQAPRQKIYMREVQDTGGQIQNTVIADLGEVIDPGDDSKG